MAAVVLVYLALASPLAAAADDYLLSAHMLEHLLLGDLAIALALLAVRGPLVFFLLPPAVLSPLARSRGLRRLLHWLTGPWVVLGVWTLVMWSWHVPRVYDYAATHPAVHELEHLTFVVAGLLLWNLLIDPARTGRVSYAGRAAVGIGALLLAEPVMGLLLNGGADYPHYAKQDDRLLGLGPRQDQRLAGVLMLGEQLATIGTCCVLLLVRQLEGRAGRAGHLTGPVDPAS